MEGLGRRMDSSKGPGGAVTDTGKVPGSAATVARSGVPPEGTSQTGQAGESLAAPSGKCWRPVAAQSNQEGGHPATGSSAPGQDEPVPRGVPLGEQAGHAPHEEAAGARGSA